MTEQKLSYYLTKAKSLQTDKFNKKIRVAFLSSFTINGAEETLRVKCAEKKIDCKTYVAGYNQYAQNILNVESFLYKFSPDVTFLILDTKSILGNIFHFPYSISSAERSNLVETKLNELLNLIDVFTKRTDSKLVLTNLNIPTYSPYGISETKEDYGFKNMIIDFNNKLTSRFTKNDSVYIYDFNSFITRFGENNVFDYKQYFFGDIKISLDHIPHLMNDFMGYLIAILGLSKRCIVLDLDNTLWGGIVGEDGFDGIRLGPEPPGNAYQEFQRVLLSLYQRGVLLAINSKNNPEDALKVITEHPHMILKKEHFASIKINWNDKVSNMKEIASELNFGFDFMVYFDDDPVNRELVRTKLPQILTVDLPNDPSQYPKILQNMNEFNTLKITDEDVKRGQMFLQQQKRKELEHMVTNLEDFLKELDLKISILPADQFTIPRISQLTLKTNQFNLTTKRYQEEDIKKFANDDKFLIGCAQVEDKFGDNGITGVFIVKKATPKEWILDTFLLSCRVMGRDIEKGILGYIIKKAKEEGIERIKAQYIATSKNKPIENFLPNCGFIKEGDYWVYSKISDFKIPHFLTISVK
ncbi:MAG: HAD-IIIC family phosphatase [Nitrososphaerota archaeon]